jgi:hypothetical protein
MGTLTGRVGNVTGAAPVTSWAGSHRFAQDAIDAYGRLDEFARRAPALLRGPGQLASVMTSVGDTMTQLGRRGGD